MKRIITIKYLATIIIIFVSLIFISFKIEDRKSKLVGYWKQFAFKENGSTEIHQLPDGCSCKTISFQENGLYEEEMYCLKSTGKWYFNNDQTKLGFTLGAFNGASLPVSTDTTKITNIIIIKLTSDTLIYGTEGYYGNAKIYGHDDWYFVRVKK